MIQQDKNAGEKHVSFLTGEMHSLHLLTNEAQQFATLTGSSKLKIDRLLVNNRALQYFSQKWPPLEHGILSDTGLPLLYKNDSVMLVLQKT